MKRAAAASAAAAAAVGWIVVVMAGLVFFPMVRMARADEPTNVALNKPATASSEESDEHAASKANDGNDNTRWCADSGDTPQWWQVDLQTPTDLTGAEIRWEMDGKNYQYVIEGSTDATNWQTLSDQSNATSKSQTQTLNFKAGGIRYVRIRITGLSDGSWASIFEVKIFGS